MKRFRFGILLVAFICGCDDRTNTPSAEETPARQSHAKKITPVSADAPYTVELTKDEIDVLDLTFLRTFPNAEVAKFVRRELEAAIKRDASRGIIATAWIANGKTLSNGTKDYDMADFAPDGSDHLIYETKATPPSIFTWKKYEVWMKAHPAKKPTR